jgi:hypothetical protein
MPYGPRCCCTVDCPPAAMEWQAREVYAELYGYAGFLSPPATYFRTAVSRGWSGVFGSGAIINNRVHCSFLPLGLSLAGSCDSKAYAENPTFPPGSEYLVSSSSNCNAGFLSFHQPPWTNTVNNTSMIGLPLSDDVTGEVVVPGGQEFLLNQITLAIVNAEVKAAARAAAWATTGLPVAQFREAIDILGGETEPTTLGLLLRLLRIRWKFQPPASGGYRVKWKLQWTPFVWSETENELVDGTPAEPEDWEWEWDRVTPGDYDPEDEATWPRSPWFETPEPTENGKYTLLDVVHECGPTVMPTTPDGVFAIAA